jgi:hypothetical protein
MQPSPTHLELGPVAAGELAPPRRSRRGRTSAAVVAAALVAIGAGVFAVNSYARHAICAEVKDALLPDATSWSGAAGDLRSHSRRLLFDDDLKSTALTLAGDLDRMAALEPTVEAGTRSATATGKLLVIAGTVNAHARTAQQACGLPLNGVFGG